MLAPWQKPASVLILALGCAVVRAQDNPCLQRTVLVSAMENSGKQLSSLNSDVFDARIGRQKIRITAVSPAPVDRRAVLLLDVSGSMSGDRSHKKWPTAVTIAKQVLSSAPPNLSLSMIAFSGTFSEKVDFGPSARSEIADRLQKYAAMSPRGPTPLLDTIDQTSGVFTPPRIADAIYLISDAGDNSSKDTVGRVRKRLLASGVRLHLIYIRANGMTSFEDKPDTFSTLALESGGWVIDVPASLEQESGRLRQTIATAVNAMLSDPLVQVHVTLPYEVSKWQYWNLRVLDEHGRKSNKLMLLYPHLLAPKACINSTGP